MNIMKRIIDFLLRNGYKEDSSVDEDYKTFFKEGVSAIDINNEEIVLIGEEGDWLHLPVNYYALLGALLEFREIAVDYKS